MKDVPVIASVETRLQADVILVRLRKAGIPCKRISVAFPMRLMPNAVACWLDVVKRPILWLEGEPIYAAGPLCSIVSNHTNVPALVDRLEKAGLGHEVACTMAERLELSSIVFCIHARNDSEASLAWDVLQHSTAEIIAVRGELAELTEVGTEARHSGTRRALAA
jgi:hypothetical protein